MRSMNSIASLEEPRVIKNEKELLRLILKDMGLGGHNVDIKKKKVIAKEVHKAVEYGLKDLPTEEHEEMLDAIAEMFLTRIGDMKEEEFTKALYTNLLSSMMSGKKHR